MFPALHQLCAGATLRGGVVRRSALVSFWRFLDTYETYMSEKGVPIRRIERLHDITSLHLQMYSTPGPEGSWKATKDTRVANIRSIIRAAISDQGLPELLLSRFSEPQQRKETPDQESGIDFIRFLKLKVHAVLARWRRSDELAASGRDLIAAFPDGIPRTILISEADAHATYRGHIKRTGNPILRLPTFMKALGIRTGAFPEYWARHEQGHARAGLPVNMHELASGLFPTSGDICLFYLLYLARSAWNPATVASIDIENWTSPYDDEHAWLFAAKVRSGGSLQWTVSSTNNATSCHAIVRALIERSLMLRTYASSNLGSSSLPDVSTRSPWVGVTVKASGYAIYVVDPYDTKTVNNRLTQFLKEYNATAKEGMKIPRMTSSEFRDVATAAIYKDSQYSSWITLILLGHKDLATSRRYGFRRSSYAESFSLLSGVVEDVLGQIAVKRKFDITLTRAKLAGMDISKADIDRLQTARRNRTADGSGCSNPYSPPIEIDPGNRRDGCDICVQQHRCAASGCPNAFVFSDSLQGLCKRVAELEHVQLTVGAVRFDSSSDAPDLRTLRLVLKQWSDEEVEAEVRRWRQAIADGIHMITWFAGRH